MKHTKAFFITLLLAAACLLALAGCGGGENPLPEVPNGSLTSGSVGGETPDTPEPTPTEGLRYGLNLDGESYSVIGIGTATDTDIVIAGTYEGKPVTGIGGYAFEGCYNLTSITIPSSVTSIGASAFRGCTGPIQKENGVSYVDKWAIDCDTSVTSVSLRANTVGIGDYTFYDCDSLTSITIPSSVTSIGYAAFNRCIGLTSIEIPSSVTSIGSFAFENCDGLTSITFAEGSQLASIGGWAFYKCTNLTAVYITDLAGWCNISCGDSYANPLGYAHNLYLNGTLVTDLVIPSSVTSIGDGVFGGCYNLKNVTIPSSVTSIGDWAFSRCTSLTSITIPSSVTSIGDGAFSNCTSLTSITIPSSVTSIEDYAFRGCTGLIQKENGVSYVDKWAIACDTSVTSVSLRANTVGIGGSAFYDCDSLMSIKIPSSVTSIGERAFYGCTGLTSIEIPAGVTSIGSSAFSSCTSLTSITIPSSVTSIGDGAFSNCTSLTSITIPSSVTSIGDYAFRGCSALVSITIPENVTSIGDYAFAYCTGLTSITIPENVTSIGSNVFEKCNNLIGNEYENAYYLGNSKNPHIVLIKAKDKNITSCRISADTKSINSYAFSNCTSLTSIEIPSSVTSIGDWAFSSCTSLTSITIPSSVTSIGGYAFWGCAKLVEVYNLSSLSIGTGSYDNVGYYILNIYTSTSGESKLHTVNDYIFYEDGDTVYLISYIGSDTELVLPNYKDKNYSIYRNAFSGCRSLTSIEIPSSVTSIESSAFRGCSALESITLPFVGATKDGTSYTHFGYIFGASSYSYHDDYVPSSLKTVIITGGSRIGDYEFAYCDSLTSIEIPSSVMYIKSSAFSGCDSLTSVTFAEGSQLKSIGNKAFYNCTGLTRITIPASVTSIGERAFDGCYKLFQEENGVSYVDKWIIGCDPFVASVSLRADTVGIGDVAFRGCASLTSISFGGTIAEWNAMPKGGDWDADTTEYTVTCTDGVLDKSGNVIG